jgi:predicted alpha/beta-hydrolase family hydrolase
VPERLHRPAAPSGDALVLTHGAGSNADAPLLAALAGALAEHGLTVLRYELPFRRARPTGPPRPADAAADREGLREAVTAMRREATGGVFLGGHSYGGRQASLLAAEAPGLADALLLLAYPLHPPRRRGEPRTTHFPGLATPTLFVHGARDPFGSLDELEAARRLIPARTALHALEGAGHALIRAGRPAAAAAAVAAIAAAFLEFTRGPG